LDVDRYHVWGHLPDLAAGDAAGDGQLAGGFVGVLGFLARDAADPNLVRGWVAAHPHHL
jgi:hypothetical protein